MHPSLVQHFSPPCCRYPTRYGIYRLVYPRNLSSWKKSCTLKFPTSRNSSVQTPKHGSQRVRLRHYESKEYEQVFEDAEVSSVVLVARQSILKPSTLHHVPVATKPNSLRTIKPWILRSNRQCTLATRVITNILPGRPSCIVVSNFSNRDIHLLFHMKIAYTANPPIVIHADDKVDRNAAFVGTPKADVNSISSQCKRLERSNTTPFWSS